MIKVISFDMDGTLVDEVFDKLIWNEEIPKLYAEKNALSLEAAKNEVFSEYKSLKGHPRWTDISFWFEKFELKNYNKIMNDMKQKIKLYPETLQTLKNLKENYTLIIITQAEKTFIEMKLKTENLSGFFSNIFSTVSDFKKLEKDEEIYKEILKTLKIKPEEMVHVGDHFDFDYQIPTKLGIKAFYLDRDKKHSGAHVIRSLDELEQKLVTFNR